MTIAILILTVPENEKILENFICSINKVLGSKQDYIIYIERNNWEGFGVACNRAIKEVLKRKYIDGIITANDDMLMIEEGKKCLYDMKKISAEKNGIVSTEFCFRKTHIAMGFCYFPRRILEDVGIFDERFKMLEWEDTDLSVRIQEAGYTLNSLPYQAVMHGGGVTRKRLNEEQKNEVRKNKERFLEKWKGTKWEKMFR